MEGVVPPVTDSDETLIGARALGVLDLAIGAVVAAVGVLVLAGALLAYGAPVDNPLFARELPLIVGACLAALGGVVAAVGVALLRETDEGRVSGIAVGAFAVATVYLQIHVASIVLTGTVFGGDLRILFAGIVATVAYAGPKIAYLTEEEVVEHARRVSRVEPPKAADPEEARVLDPEPVEGGETIEPPVVRAEKITSRGVPEGTVAKTTCTMCDTDLGVPTHQRPVVVECVECGTHGQLSGRRSGRPAGRPSGPSGPDRPSGRATATAQPSRTSGGDRRGPGDRLD